MGTVGVARSKSVKGGGTRTTTATEGALSTASIIGTSNVITVSPAAATSFTVTGSPTTLTAGSAASFTVTAKDTFGNVATTYGGTAHFSTSDPLAVVPNNTTLTNGAATFNVTLKTVGPQTVSANDAGAPGINGTSNPITVNPGLATHFTVVGAPTTVTAGTATSFSVTAFDSFGNVATNYHAGTVGFTSSDPLATPPSSSTLVGGMGVFSEIFKKVGSQTLTAADTSSGGVNGTSNAITVNPAAASTLIVSAGSSTAAGVPLTVTVTAKDTFGNLATGYTGTVHFVSTDISPGVVLPAPYTFVPSDSGSHIFANGATLVTAGVQTVTAIDTLNSNTNGTTGPITVSPGAATHYAVSGSPTIVAIGGSVSFTVKALDAFGNNATGYTGTVGFTVSNNAGTPPANSTLSSGVGVFTVVLNASGNQTLTAKDINNGTITGTSNAIAVSPGAATHYTVTGAPATVAAGGPTSFTVMALDSSGNVANGYTGTVRFTTTDPLITAPSNSTLTNGIGIFTVNFEKAGGETLTATDTSITSLTATSNVIVVTAGTAAKFTLNAPATAAGSVPFNFTVSAQDSFGNAASNYSGTVHFSTSDAAGTVPADSTLTNGTGTFSATLVTSPSQTITASDTTTSSITGSAVVGLTTDIFSVSAQATATAGAPFNFTVTALNATTHAVDVNFNGTVHFSSSDGLATLPADYTFVPALDAGSHAFSATLEKSGSQTLIASSLAAVTGFTNVQVNSTAATHFAITAAGNAAAGTPFTFTVSALDQFNNIAGSFYGGIVLSHRFQRQPGHPAGQCDLDSRPGGFQHHLQDCGHPDIVGH